MFRKSIVVQFTILFSISLLLLASSIAGQRRTSQKAPAPNLQPADCSTVTDAEIVDLILASLRANLPKKRFRNDDLNVRFRDKNLTFRPVCEDKVVKLLGGVTNADIFVDVINVIKTINSPTKGKVSDCIKIIDVKNFRADGPGTCGGNLQPCNGGCIGPLEHCPRIDHPTQ